MNPQWPYHQYSVPSPYSPQQLQQTSWNTQDTSPVTPTLNTNILPHAPVFTPVSFPFHVPPPNIISTRIPPPAFCPNFLPPSYPPVSISNSSQLNASFSALSVETQPPLPPGTPPPLPSESPPPLPSTSPPPLPLESPPPLHSDSSVSPERGQSSAIELSVSSALALDDSSFHILSETPSYMPNHSQTPVLNESPLLSTELQSPLPITSASVISNSSLLSTTIKKFKPLSTVSSVESVKDKCSISKNVLGAVEADLTSTLFKSPSVSESSKESYCKDKVYLPNKSSNTPTVSGAPMSANLSSNLMQSTMSSVLNTPMAIASNLVSISKSVSVLPTIDENSSSSASIKISSVPSESSSVAMKPMPLIPTVLIDQEESPVPVESSIAQVVSSVCSTTDSSSTINQLSILNGLIPAVSNAFVISQSTTLVSSDGSNIPLFSNTAEIFPVSCTSSSSELTEFPPIVSVKLTTPTLKNSSVLPIVSQSTVSSMLLSEQNEVSVPVKSPVEPVSSICLSIDSSVTTIQPTLSCTINNPVSVASDSTIASESASSASSIDSNISLHAVSTEILPLVSSIPSSVEISLPLPTDSLSPTSSDVTKLFSMEDKSSIPNAQHESSVASIVSVTCVSIDSSPVVTQSMLSSAFNNSMNIVSSSSMASRSAVSKDSPSPLDNTSASAFTISSPVKLVNFPSNSTEESSTIILTESSSSLSESFSSIIADLGELSTSSVATVVSSTSVSLISSPVVVQSGSSSVLKAATSTLSTPPQCSKSVSSVSPRRSKTISFFLIPVSFSPESASSGQRNICVVQLQPNHAHTLETNGEATDTACNHSPTIISPFVEESANSADKEVSDPASLIKTEESAFIHFAEAMVAHPTSSKEFSHDYNQSEMQNPSFQRCRIMMEHNYCSFNELNENNYSWPKYNSEQNLKKHFPIKGNLFLTKVIANDHDYCLHSEEPNYQVALKKEEEILSDGASHQIIVPSKSFCRKQSDDAFTKEFSLNVSEIISKNNGDPDSKTNNQEVKYDENDIKIKQEENVEDSSTEDKVKINDDDSDIEIKHEINYVNYDSKIKFEKNNDKSCLELTKSQSEISPPYKESNSTLCNIEACKNICITDQPNFDSSCALDSNLCNETNNFDFVPKFKQTEYSVNIENQNHKKITYLNEIEKSVTKVDDSDEKLSSKILASDENIYNQSEDSKELACCKENENYNSCKIVYDSASLNIENSSGSKISDVSKNTDDLDSSKDIYSSEFNKNMYSSVLSKNVESLDSLKNTDNLVSCNNISSSPKGQNIDDIAIRKNTDDSNFIKNTGNSNSCKNTDNLFSSEHVSTLESRNDVDNLKSSKNTSDSVFSKTSKRLINYSDSSSDFDYSEFTKTNYDPVVYKNLDSCNDSKNLDSSADIDNLSSRENTDKSLSNKSNDQNHKTARMQNEGSDRIYDYLEISRLDSDIHSNLNNDNSKIISSDKLYKVIEAETKKSDKSYKITEAETKKSDMHFDMNKTNVTLTDSDQCSTSKESKKNQICIIGNDYDDTQHEIYEYHKDTEKSDKTKFDDFQNDDFHKAFSFHQFYNQNSGNVRDQKLDFCNNKQNERDGVFESLLKRSEHSNPAVSHKKRRRSPSGEEERKKDHRHRKRKHTHSTKSYETVEHNHSVETHRKRVHSTESSKVGISSSHGSHKRRERSHSSRSHRKREHRHSVKSPRKAKERSSSRLSTPRKQPDSSEKHNPHIKKAMDEQDDKLLQTAKNCLHYNRSSENLKSISNHHIKSQENIDRHCAKSPGSVKSFDLLRSRTPESVKSLNTHRSRSPESIKGINRHHAKSPGSIKGFDLLRSRSPESINRHCAKSPESLKGFDLRRSRSPESVKSINTHHTRSPGSIKDFDQQRSRSIESSKSNISHHSRSQKSMRTFHDHHSNIFSKNKNVSGRLLDDTKDCNTHLNNNKERLPFVSIDNEKDYNKHIDKERSQSVSIDVSSKNKMRHEEDKVKQRHRSSHRINLPKSFSKDVIKHDDRSANFDSNKFVESNKERLRSISRDYSSKSKERQYVEDQKVRRRRRSRRRSSTPKDLPCLSLKTYKYVCSTPADDYYFSKDKDSKEVVAKDALKALHEKFRYELVERAERIRASKPKYEPPKRKTKLRKPKPPKTDSNSDSSSSSEKSSSEEEDTSMEELERKKKHPYRLHLELWFNDPKEMNDGPLCRCSAKARRAGIRHGIYVGEDHLPLCDPLSNNADKLFHYRITMTPHTNFLTKNPTTIIHDGLGYRFEGFSMFSHSKLPSLPNCKVIRFNYEYTIVYAEEDFPKNFTVGGLELFSRYLLVEILELVDLNWKAHNDPDGCPRFHLMPRFARELKDGGKELLSHCYVLEYLLKQNKILVDENQLKKILSLTNHNWQDIADKVKGMIVTCPGMKPSSIRVDQLDREQCYPKKEEFPVIVHFGVRPPQLSYAGNPHYQKAWRDYVKYRHLLANKPKVRYADRHKLQQKEMKLQEMRMENDLKRDVTVVISSKNFYKTGIMSDVVQHAMLLPVLVCHLRFHQSLTHLENKIGYQFQDRFLLQLALTHPSYRENFGTNPDHARNSLTNCGLRQPQYGDRRIHYMNTRKRGINTLINIMSRFGSRKETLSRINHNERLEFLGDAVVEFLSSIHLFYMFPDLEEGGLATYRAAIVQNQHLAVLSKKLELDRFMLYAHGSDLCHDLELRHAMANCFEALMGALFLDNGIEIADQVFSKTLFSEPELLEVWMNFSPHPLQEQEPGGDRKWIESVPLLQKLHRFEETIGIEFNHIRLLARALTHRSLGYNNLTLGSNQRLEFLGDTVLQLVASEYLYKFFPEHHEGHLSLLRSSLVNNRTQAVVCADLGMVDYAIYPYDKVELKPKDKADLLEAFLGALYVDKDLGYCRKFCEVCFFPRLQDFIMNQDWNDPKSKLQQCCLTLRSMDGGEPDIPTYKVIECKGPTNTRVYSVAVYFQGNRLAVGSGHSIQQAEMDAAFNALNMSKDLFPQLRHQRRAIERSLKKRPLKRLDSKYSPAKVTDKNSDKRKHSPRKDKERKYDKYKHLPEKNKQRSSSHTDKHSPKKDRKITSDKVKHSVKSIKERSSDRTKHSSKQEKRKNLDRTKHYSKENSVNKSDKSMHSSKQNIEKQHSKSLHSSKEVSEKNSESSMFVPNQEIEKTFIKETHSSEQDIEKNFDKDTHASEHDIEKNTHLQNIEKNFVKETLSSKQDIEKNVHLLKQDIENETDLSMQLSKQDIENEIDLSMQLPKQDIETNSDLNLHSSKRDIENNYDQCMQPSKPNIETNFDLSMHSPKQDIETNSDLCVQLPKIDTEKSSDLSIHSPKQDIENSSDLCVQSPKRNIENNSDLSVQSPKTGTEKNSGVRMFLQKQDVEKNVDESMQSSKQNIERESNKSMYSPNTDDTEGTSEQEQVFSRKDSP